MERNFSILTKLVIIIEIFIKNIFNTTRDLLSGINDHYVLTAYLYKLEYLSNLLKLDKSSTVYLESTRKSIFEITSGEPLRTLLMKTCRVTTIAGEVHILRNNVEVSLSVEDYNNLVSSKLYHDTCKLTVKNL